MGDCIFCDFISDEKKQHCNILLYGMEKAKRIKKSYEVIDIINNKKALAFLTPPNNLGESEIIVIPKEHYEFFEDLPKNFLKELVFQIQEMVMILRKEYGDCKILLNDGRNAEQYIPHVHFHLIFKNKNKKNIWKKLSVAEHFKLSRELKTKLLKT